jgi:hypothetical protein
MRSFLPAPEGGRAGRKRKRGWLVHYRRGGWGGLKVKPLVFRRPPQSCRTRSAATLLAVDGRPATARENRCPGIMLQKTSTTQFLDGKRFHGGLRTNRGTQMNHAFVKRSAGNPNAMPCLDIRAPMPARHSFIIQVHNAVIIDKIHARAKLFMPAQKSRKVQKVVRVRAIQKVLVRRRVNAAGCAGRTLLGHQTRRVKLWI